MLHIILLISSVDWCLLSAVQPNKVYIGGLPEHTRQEDLQSCFGKIGSIVNIELKYVIIPGSIYYSLTFLQSWLWFCCTSISEPMIR